MKLGEPDEKGRRRPVQIEGTNFSIAVDTAIKALGYWPDPAIGETTTGLQTHSRGLITVVDKEMGTTSRPGIYAAGDIVTGPDLVATAMIGGRKAAQAINEYLKSK
jgi:glutamate synthase (NADPH/NADH) small chain